MPDTKVSYTTRAGDRQSDINIIQLGGTILNIKMGSRRTSQEFTKTPREPRIRRLYRDNMVA